VSSFNDVCIFNQQNAHTSLTPHFFDLHAQNTVGTTSKVVPFLPEDGWA